MSDDAMFRDDGRRSKVECKGCGASEDLLVAIDPIEDTLIVGCPNCREDIAIGDIRFADVSLTFSPDSVDDVTPELRDDLKEAMEDA